MSDVRKRAWAFRSWFVERIGLDSTGHSWNSPAIADNHHWLRLGGSHCILVVRIPGQLLHSNSRRSLAAAGVDSLYSAAAAAGCSTTLKQTARLRVGARGGRSNCLL